MTKLAARHNLHIDWSDAHKTQMIATSRSMLNAQLDSTPWKKLYTHIASIATWEDEAGTIGIYEDNAIATPEHPKTPTNNTKTTTKPNPN